MSRVVAVVKSDLAQLATDLLRNITRPCPRTYPTVSCPALFLKPLAAMSRAILTTVQSRLTLQILLFTISGVALASSVSKTGSGGELGYERSADTTRHPDAQRSPG